MNRIHRTTTVVFATVATMVLAGCTATQEAPSVANSQPMFAAHSAEFTAYDVADNPLATAMAGACARAITPEDVANVPLLNVGTTVHLSVGGVNAPDGTHFLAHVHTGPCSAPGGHTMNPGDNKEIHLDFDVNAGGAFVTSAVDFAVDPSKAKSIVIHDAKRLDESTTPPKPLKLGCIALDFTPR